MTTIILRASKGSGLTNTEIDANFTNLNTDKAERVSPTLVTPVLGTPVSVTLTNATGLPVATGISGLGTNVASFLSSPSSANLAAALTDETGTGANVFATSPTLVTPALGTPASGIMTNVTGTAAGLTAGTVTTNANLTGPVSSVGNATSFTSGMTLPAVTLGGTVSGGGNQINNVIIGTTTPLAGSFTTVTASTAIGTASGGTGLGGATPFTANGVVFASSASALTTGSALTFDGTLLTNNQSSAASGLLLNLQNSSTGSFMQFAQPGVANLLFGCPNADAFTWRTFGSGTYPEQMRLTATGLGIGVSSPSQKLELAGILRVKNGNADTNGLNFSSDAAGVSTINSGYAGAGVIRFLTSDDEKMRLTNAGNVGIGTSSPGERLHVAGGCVQVTGNLSSLNRPSSAIMDFFSGQTRFFSIGADSATSGGFSFRTSTTTTNTERMALDSSGNLGLGVTPSAWGTGFRAIDTFSAGAISATALLDLDCNAFFNSSSNWIYKSTAEASRYFQSGGAHNWQTAPSGTAGNAISFTQAMTLNAAGELLVGATSPLYSTGGRGNITLNGAATAIIGLGIANVAAGYLYTDANIVSLASESTRALTFVTNGTERVRIDSSGNLLVGTTSTSMGTSGRGVIEVNGASDAVFATKVNGTLAAVSGLASLTEVIYGAVTNVPVVFRTNNTERARIDSAGNVGIGTTTPATKLHVNGTVTATTFVGTVDGTDAIGFRNIPQNTQSAAYTLVLADSGKHIFHDSGAAAATYTIPANSSVAYAIGTTIAFVNMSSNVVTIAITTDTMYLSGTGTTGSRSLAQYGAATALKIAATTWMISGSGLT